MKERSRKEENMCLYPRLIKNRKYTKTKKNGGNIPEIKDGRTMYVPIGCGKCIECMKLKKREWQTRLMEEVRTDKSGKFVTLTFDNESLKELTKLAKKECGIKDIEENEVARIAVRRFLERWRKKYRKSVKHWLITELGHNGTERIHLHGIIFTDKTKEEIEDRWMYGIVWVGTFVNEKTINYITKYCTKMDEVHKGYTPKILTSAGIGKAYVERPDAQKNKYNGEETEEVYRTRTGTKLALPIYWRNKIYDEEEREQLWIFKLDKQERWVCGEKVDVSTPEGEKQYEELREYHRKRNKRLGYGDDSKEWSSWEYKESQRKLKIAKKLANEKNKQ